MITLTFAGDESGDVSFTFGKGASRYFVTAVIATRDPEGLRNLLAELRRKSSLPDDYEFKFHDLTSAALRERTFTALAKAQFEGWGLIVDKTTLPDAFKLMSGLDFYLYFITELVQSIPEERRDGATLILDEFGSVEQTRKELRRVFKIRGILPLFKRLLIKRSRSESLIQVADLIAGAILHRDSRSSARSYEIIAEKMCKVQEFQP